jgi:hypothetical protein
MEMAVTAVSAMARNLFSLSRMASRMRRFSMALAICCETKVRMPFSCSP